MGRHNLQAGRKDAVVDEVVARVEELFKLLPGSLYYGEAGNVVTARRFAWYVLYMRWQYSYPQIADRFGGYDHTTIRAGVLAISDSLKHDREVQRAAAAAGAL